MSSPDSESGTEVPVAQLRAQLKLILESSEFTASRRASDFLRFVCEAAFSGRSDLEQIEIARTLLHRGGEFNPVEDASVRKLATLTRQRLESYYAGPGKDDPVRIQIPPRSYLPRFRARQDAPTPIHEAYPRRLIGACCLLITCALLALLGVAWYRTRTDSDALPPGRIAIAAKLGEINAGRSDAPPTSILVGSPVGAHDTVTVRMTFTPNEELEQAGIMIFTDADNYVKLSRCFLHRTQFEFVVEEDGKYLRQYPDSLHYDPEGQNGQPVWLAIRRNGREFRAYISGDGRIWRPLGPPLRSNLSRTTARVAVFAFAERQSAQPAQAIFEHLGVGPPLPDWDGQGPSLAALDGWEQHSACAETAVSMPDMLQLTFPPGTERCRWWLRHPVPSGDWVLSAVVDTLSWARTFAGIDVRGSKSTFSVVCNYSNGGSIVIEHPPYTLARRPMLPGSPPITLRIRNSGSVISAEAGRSLDQTEPFNVSVKAAELGEPLSFSFHAGRGTRRDESVLAPVGFRWGTLEQTALRNYR